MSLSDLKQKIKAVEKNISLMISELESEFCCEVERIEIQRIKSVSGNQNKTLVANAKMKVTI